MTNSESDATKHVLKKQRAKGKSISYEKARGIAKARIEQDKTGGASFKYDFAGDGAGKKDVDRGSGKAAAMGYTKGRSKGKVSGWDKTKSGHASPTKKPISPSKDFGGGRSFEEAAKAAGMKLVKPKTVNKQATDSEISEARKHRAWSASQGKWTKQPQTQKTHIVGR